MLSEDRIGTIVPSVYRQINNPDVPDTANEDPFDADNDRHYGFSQENPHVIKTTTNVVVIPSINKWNCFSVRDRRTVDILGSGDTMNTATSVSPTSSLEINNLFNDKITCTDYPVQAGRSSGNELTRNNSGYRRLTLREKVTKQRSEREDDLPKSTKSSVDGSTEEPRNSRLTKATSVGGASTSVTNNHRPTVRSQSNNAITEERTVFGFKVMKGLRSNSDAANNNNNTSTTFTRQGSSRQPVKTTHHSTTSRFNNKAGSTLFYIPKSARDSTNKSEVIAEPQERESGKEASNSVGSGAKVDTTSSSSRDVEKKSVDTVEKLNKDSSSIRGKTISRDVLNTDTKRTRNVNVKESSRTSRKYDKSDMKTDNKNDENEIPDDEVFGVNKETEGKTERGKKAENLLIRAESLREGKSRLEEFREKQRRGKLTRSLTNPDFEQSENTASKGKNISDSLAEIRERIRERRKKKEMFKKSRSMPETELPPKEAYEENTKEISDDTTDKIRKSKQVKPKEFSDDGQDSIGKHKETKQSGKVTKSENNTEKLSSDGKDNIRSHEEVEVSRKTKRTEKSRVDERSSLNELEYLEIEENSKMNNNDENVAVLDSRCEDVITEDSNKVIIEKTKDKKEKVKDTGDNEVVVTDTVEQVHLKAMDKKDFDTKESDREISEGGKIQLKEILSNEKRESTSEETTSLSKQKEVTDAKTEVEISSSNDTNTAAPPSDQTDVKKPTKRERRKRERYQRSKTMSAIMYNEISLDARREMQHKGSETKSEKNGESLGIASVSDIKKRFLEAESGSTKISELGLFYSGKSTGKLSVNDKSTSRSKPAQKVSSKDDSNTNRGKSSESRTRKYISRRHTLATGNSLQNNVAQERDVETILAKNNELSTTDKTKSTEAKTQTKIPLGRRHTLPSFTTDVSEDKQLGDSNSSVSSTKKEVTVSGGRLPVRRHTFCSQTSLMISRHSPIKLSESVEALRERFSKGGVPVFNLATSSSKVNTTKTSRTDADCNERNRRRVRSDSSLQFRLTTEEPKDVNKETTSGSSLTRRHTIANRPALARQNTANDKQERQEFFEKFLAKDDEIQKPEKSEERKVTKDVKSRTEESGQTFTRAKKDKEEKMSVLKLRKLFIGPASTEKKTKLRDRRAKTIAGGISPEMMKELNVNKSSNVLANKHVVKPDNYVSGTTKEKSKEEQDRPQNRRRSSDLNPDSYLSPISLSPEETEGSVFSEDNSSHDKVSSDVKSPTKTTTVSAFNSTRQQSGGKSDLKISISMEDEKSSREEAQQQNSSSDVVSLKTPTDTCLPAFNPARRRSGSESDMSSDVIKDQCLDEYLTTIKTLGESPKAQRTSPRGSPQKGKFAASHSFDQDEETTKTKRSLSVVKNLSMHSWSTSDLDKIIHGDGTSPSASQVDISSMDFDEISSSTTRLQSLTEGRTKVRPKRASSKTLNPMKSLLERADVRTHTEEAEEENKSEFEKPKKRSNPRKKRSQLEPWRRHTLDPVAIAALASREDFSRVSLRKTKGPGKEKDEYDGSMPVMLIQIKGRRQVQTRLVEPSLSSLNTGDCFILVTPKEIFCWIGQHANAIEKAKAVEVSSKIQKRGDMNCKTGDVLYIDETKQGNNLAYRKFCKILEGDTTFPIEDAHLCPDDEFYEREMISTNMVYKLQEGDPPHLIPVTEHCGYMPQIGILNTKEVYVFDFGSELYLWTGQQSLSGKRKVAFHLAEMLYKQKFDCEALVSPIEPRRPLKRTQSSKPVYRDADGKERGRPTWALFARLHEKAETLLFQEKFYDWPDPTKIIKMKGHVSSGEIQERPPAVELKPCDPTEMQKPACDLEPAILEATNLGRGLGTPNIEVNGEVKEGDQVATLGVAVWLVSQNKHFVLPKQSEGHFHSGDGYVIRWVYFVAKNRVVRDKRGRIRQPTGRQRCAYFFWQGNECSVNEKGAAAIMTVELDEEHGPQIRVVEGKEPPHFLKLFDGAMVIHSGKRTRVSEEEDDFSDKSTVRMYCIRNDEIKEGCLVQVKRSASSLRSRSSFIVVDSEAGNIFVWHGCKANEYHRKSAEKAAKFIKDRRPLEMNLSEEMSMTLTEVEEARESDIFWTTVSGKKNSYLSLVKDPLNYDFSPRLFHMTSATGQFISTEILSPSRYPGRTCPFPVLQDDLYSASQPAVFLLDVGDEVYVWEGWMPAEITQDKRGSAKRRWDEERKLTLQTTLSYVKEANGRINKGAYVVQAGLEPLSFTTHFPFWNRRQSITEINQMEGKKDYEKKPVKDAFDNFNQKYYSFQELTSDDPPDGVDPSKLEVYLTDDEFQIIFEMPRDLFGKLPGWKQDILKKAFGLF